MKSFQDEELPHELFLGTRQETKISNTFANNMSREIKLSKSQISKIIQSGGSFGSSLANLGKKLLTSIAILLVRDNLPGFVNIKKNIFQETDYDYDKGLTAFYKFFPLF